MCFKTKTVDHQNLNIVPDRDKKKKKNKLKTQQNVRMTKQNKKIKIKKWKTVKNKKIGHLYMAQCTLFSSSFSISSPSSAICHHSQSLSNFVCVRTEIFGFLCHRICWFLLFLILALVHGLDVGFVVGSTVGSKSGIKMLVRLSFKKKRSFSSWIFLQIFVLIQMIKMHQKYFKIMTMKWAMIIPTICICSCPPISLWFALKVRNNTDPPYLRNYVHFIYHFLT